MSQQLCFTDSGKFDPLPTGNFKTLKAVASQIVVPQPALARIVIITIIRDLCIAFNPYRT